MTPSRVRAFAKGNGLSVRHFHMYEGYDGWVLRRRSRLIWMLCKAAQILGKVLSFGKYDILLATYAIVVSKTQQPVEDSRHGESLTGTV